MPGCHLQRKGRLAPNRRALEIPMPTPKGNRSKKKLSNRAKPKRAVLKRRRVRARKAKGKY